MHILGRLHKKCMGKGGMCSRPAGGKHRLCNGKVARRAAIFHRELCESILQGLRDEMRALRRTRPGESGSVEIIGVMHDADDEIALAQKDYEMLGIHGSEQGWAPLTDDASPRGGAFKHQDVIGRPLCRNARVTTRASY